MLKNRYTLHALFIGLIIAATATNSFGQQTIQVQNDNSLSMGSWGAAYSTNLWSSSYIGFNLKKTGIWGGPWATFSDGANNGAAGIIGGIGGSLQFLTAPTFQGASGGQTFQDADMPAKVRMSLNGTGQLRIGTKEAIGVHSDYRLSVYGKLTAVSLYVLADNATNWADYVFADDYKLAPLPELESFLKANRHLPEMPTTSEVETNGINVAAMNTLLLKKVEELTLHLIALNKQVARLEAAQVAQK
jgi:uncharacterized protein Usg